MKNLIFITSLFIGISFSSTEEEEIKTIEQDGILYKINPASLHITPYSEEEANNLIAKESKNMDSASEIKKSEPEKSCSLNCLKTCCAKKDCCNLTISMGTVMPLGDNSDIYDPGSSLGILIPTPLDFDLFNKNWLVSGELNLSHLSGIANGDDLNMNSIIAHFTPEFNLPINIDFGIGISHLKGLGGFSGTGVIDFTYNLPLEMANLALGLRYQKFVNVSKNDPYLDFGLLDVYGFNLTFSKKLN